MTKAEFINKVFTMAGLPSKSKTEEAVNAFLEIIQEALAAGDSVGFTGFGSFKVNIRQARKCRNPRTGEAMDVPASKVVKFSAGKSLKDAVK